MRVSPVLVLALGLSSLSAQTLVVDCPDSVLGTVAGQYPIYTSTGLNVIRGQSFCPSTFVGLPAVPMICTRVGIQLSELAGPVTYTQFVVRAGSTTVPALTTTYATNLPDQRVQVDLSNQALSGGANTNVWVEWPLQFPFYYNPGDGVVIDFTTQAAVAGSSLRTCIGTGVARCINTNYTGGGAGTASTSGGLKFRMVFEPLGLVPWGSGCAGSGGITPTIGSLGQSSLGSQSLIVTLGSAMPGTISACLFGAAADFDFGGGCHVFNNAAVTLFQITGGSGVGGGTGAVGLSIPNNQSLLGYVLNAQWGVFDPGAPTGLAFSPGGKVVVY